MATNSGAILGRKSGNYAGIVIPYYRPGSDLLREYRLRRDQLPIVITEGEFKTLALWRLANHGAPTRPRFLPLGVSGIYNWRGTIGDDLSRGGTLPGHRHARR